MGVDCCLLGANVTNKMNFNYLYSSEDDYIEIQPVESEGVPNCVNWVISCSAVAIL